MRILGIDPGLADVGWGIVEQNGRDPSPRHIAHGVVRTPASEATSARLHRIYRELQNIIRAHAPEVVAMEELFFASNVKTAMAVAQGRGAAILATAESGVPLAEYSPPRIKLALVGQGRADKRQVQMMVRAVLGLDEVPKPDHAADALAVALCHLHSQGPLREIVRATKIEAKDAEETNPNKALLAQQRKRHRR